MLSLLLRMVSLAVPVLLAGCGESRGAVPPPAGTARASWQVARTPSLVIGVPDGAAEYQFDGIAGVRLRADGGLVVADRGSRELRLFDAAGRHQLTVGGAGGGPGRFESIGRVLLLRGDSIAAWDPRQKRFTVFNPDGSVARAVTFDDLPGIGGNLDGVFPDGTVLARPGLDPLQLIATAEGERRSSVTHLLRRPGATEWQRLGDFPGREEFVVRMSGSVRQLGILFGRDHVAVVGRSRWYTGDTDRFEVTVRAPDGSKIHVLRRDHSPLPVTTGDLRRARTEQQESSARARAEAARRIGRDTGDEPMPPHRSTFPAFDEVVEDAHENVWVRHYHFPRDEPQRWSVFAPTGAFITEVETPAHLRIHQVGSDSVVGTVTDELGVEYVHVHRLIRA